MNTTPHQTTPSRQRYAAFEDLRLELLELAETLGLLATGDMSGQVRTIEGAFAVCQSAFAVCARSAQSIGGRLEGFAPDAAAAPVEGGAV